MIYVLYESLEYNNTYFMKNFETREEATNFILSNDGYSLRNTRIIEGQELKLTLQEKTDNELLSIS